MSLLRGAVLGLLLFSISSNLPAQNQQVDPAVREIWTRIWPLFEQQGVLVYPPDVPRETYHNELASVAQYERDLRKFFQSDRALAQHACAAVEFLKPQPSQSFPTYDKLRLTQAAICRDFVPSESVRTWVRERFTPPAILSQTPRQKIAMQRGSSDEEKRRMMARGVYLPPPAEPEQWREGTANRDYVADLTAAFKADPSLAAVACEYAETAGRSVSDPTLIPLRDKLLQVCASFPLKDMIAAAESQHEQKVQAWLHGLMNTYRDQNATQSEDARRNEVEKIAGMIGNISRGVPRFQLALKAIALLPQDEIGPFLTLTYLHEVAYSSDPGAKPAQVKKFLEDFYVRRAQTGADALQWKRGWRSYLFLVGEFNKARDVAREIVAAKPSDDDSVLDRIYLAAMERVTGNETLFDQLMTSCPDADKRYIQKFGRPAVRAKYCQDVVAAFANHALDRIGSAAPPTLRQLFAETNRVAPLEIVAAAPQPPPAPESPVDRELQKYSAILNRELEEVKLKSEALRSGEADALLTSLDEIWGEQGIAAGFRVIALRPSDDRGPWTVIKALWAYPSSEELRRRVGPGFPVEDHAKRVAVLKILTDLYRRKVTHSEEQNDWKRGWRGFLLYTGALTEALKVSRELITLPHDPEDSPRDQALLAMLERASGNEQPLQKFLSQCPPAAPSYVRKYGTDRDYCRSAVFSIAYRSLDALRERPPAAFKEVILETKKDDWDETVTAIRTLQLGDPELARQQWERVLASPPTSMPSAAVLDVLMYLEEIAVEQRNYRQAISAVDRYLQAADFRDPGFEPESWRALATSPEFLYIAAGYRDHNQLYRMIEEKVMNALRESDFTVAQRTIETLLTLTRETGDVGNVRRLLERAAEFMINQGRRGPALRVLGYLATHPLDASSKRRIDQLVRKLPMSGEPPKLEPSRTPWDSPARPDLRKHRPKAPPAKVTAT